MSSGNLEEVRHISKNHFSLKIGMDPENSSEPKTYKNWFYFKVKGFKKHQKIILSIHNIKYNWSMWKHGFSPVFKSNKKSKNHWKVYNQKPVKIYLKKKHLSLKFEFSFEPGEIVEFALTFPYTLKKYNDYIEKYYKEIN